MRSVVRWLLQQAMSPTRCSYDRNRIMSVVTDERKTAYIRDDVDFTTSHGINIFGSLYHQDGHPIPSSIIIYSHSMGMNQFEALNLVPYLVTPELALFAFDYPASGISGGNVIVIDGTGASVVLDAVAVLKERYKMRKFAIWGRSMGAAIALQTVSMTNDFSCCVADSGFSSATAVMHNLFRRYHVPKCLYRMLDRIVRKKVMKYYKIEVDYDFPIRDIPASSTPLLIGHGTFDTIVPISEAEYIYDRYGSRDKQLYMFEAKHFKSRPHHWYAFAGKFLYRKLGMSTKPRSYDEVYRGSQLHIGQIPEIFEDLRIDKFHIDYMTESDSQSLW